MSDALIQMAIFIAIGFAWRYFKLGGVDANALQRSIMTLIQWIFLPFFVFFAMSVLTFNASLFKFTLYAVVASGVAMAAAWFWLASTNHEPRTKGALMLAACFGSVLFIGVPLTDIMIGSWSTRLAVVYLLVVNILVLYTAGLFLTRAMASPSKLKKPLTAITDEAMTIIKEPIIIAAILGLLVNASGITLPVWIGGISTLAGGALIPLLILTVGLSLTWDSSWMNQMKDIIPVAAIKLILIPVVLLIMVKVFGSPGAKTSQALMINGMMPASLLGLAVCDRFKLDTKTYVMAFAVTSILAVVAVPVWLQIM